MTPNQVIDTWLDSQAPRLIGGTTQAREYARANRTPAQLEADQRREREIEEENAFWERYDREEREREARWDRMVETGLWAREYDWEHREDCLRFIGSDSQYQEWHLKTFGEYPD